MPATDYYQVLEVSRTATPEEIKKAYRKLAKKYHPDARPDDKVAAAKFKEIQEAFDVLGDASKRQHYDRFGTAGPSPGGGGRGPGPGWSSSGGGPVDLSDLFGQFGGQVDLGDLFGNAGMGGDAARGPRRGRAQSGQDVQAELEVPFEIAAEGGTQDIRLERGGKAEHLAVKIPAGVDSGSVIRLGGQGAPGHRGGKPGDLLVTVRVAPHPYFRREGANLLVDVPLSVTEAALGAKIEVPTLSEGRVMLTIPPGTSSGAKLRLRGKGILDRSTKERGDQFVVVKVVMPTRLSDRAKQLFQELESAAPQTPRAGLWS